MPMRKLLTRLRRDFTIGAIVVNGEKIRDLRAARAGIYSDIWPDDAAMLDEVIEAAERRQERRLDYIRKTA